MAIVQARHGTNKKTLTSIAAENKDIHEGANVYIYTRVSTAMQVDGYSLEAQEEEIKRYTDRYHMNIVGNYSDKGFSGKNISGRQGFQAMLLDVDAKKDNVRFVVVFKLSRFGRNAADILTVIKRLKRRGVDLICVKEGIDSSTEQSKLFISVMAAMAEIERENIRTQTMSGRLEKARKGYWNGGFAPYGYSLVDGLLVVNEEEAEIIRLIYTKYVNTNLGMGGVAKWLNDNGYRKVVRKNIKTPTFSAAFVKTVLDNPIYCPTSEEKDVGIEPLRYRKLLADCERKFKEYEAAGCQTYCNKKDHLWTLYEYETGAFKIPETVEDGMIYGGCNCGNCHLTILPTGDVYACRRVQNSKVANVFADRLADVWVCQMEQYRDYTKFEKCSKCELLAFCRGCPAVASGKDGNFYAADPQCWKEVV